MPSFTEKTWLKKASSDRPQSTIFRYFSQHRSKGEGRGEADGDPPPWLKFAAARPSPTRGSAGRARGDYAPGSGGGRQAPSHLAKFRSLYQLGASGPVHPGEARRNGDPQRGSSSAGAQGRGEKGEKRQKKFRALWIIWRTGRRPLNYAPGQRILRWSGQWRRRRRGEGEDPDQGESRGRESRCRGSVQDEGSEVNGEVIALWIHGCS